jgi:hypothetical protein
MSRYVPVKGHSGLVRDTESNALINVDKTAIERAREKKQAKRKKRQEEFEMKQRVASLESDISEIKNMLKAILTKTD